MHVLEAGFEPPGPARRAAAARLSRARLQLAQGDAADRRRRLSRDRAGRARLRPHVAAPTSRYDDDLRAVPHAEPGARHARRWCRRSGYRSVAAVIGHDQGSPLAGWCALARPDVFRSVVMMSAPFGGPPALPFNTADAPRPAAAARRRHDLRRARGADAAAQALPALLPRRARRTRTCGTRRRASTRSCAPTTT